MLRIAITGSKGLIGSRILELLHNDFEFTELELPDFDITLKDKIKQSINNIDFDIFFHLAAYTNVDLAEQEKEIEIFEKLFNAPLAWRNEQAARLSQNIIAAQETLNQRLLWLRDRILEANGQAELAVSEQKDKNNSSKYRVANLVGACRAIQKTQSILQNSSFSAKLALEVLMMKI